MFEILKLLVQCIALTVVKNSQAHDNLVANAARNESGDVARVGNRVFFTDKGIRRLLAIGGSQSSEIVLQRTRTIRAYVFHGNRYTQASESFTSQSFAAAASAAHRRAGLEMLNKLNIHSPTLLK